MKAILILNEEDTPFLREAGCGDSLEKMITLPDCATIVRNVYLYDANTDTRYLVLGVEWVFADGPQENGYDAIITVKFDDLTPFSSRTVTRKILTATRWIVK